MFFRLEFLWINFLAIMFFRFNFSFYDVFTNICLDCMELCNLLDNYRNQLIRFQDLRAFFGYCLRFVIHKFQGDALALYNTDRIMSVRIQHFASSQIDNLQHYAQNCYRFDNFYFINALCCSFCFFPAAVSRMTWLITPLTDYGRFILITVIISLTIFSVMP